MLYKNIPTNRPYPQDLAVRIDKAKEKGNLPVFRLGKAVKALHSEGVRELPEVTQGLCVRARR